MGNVKQPDTAPRGRAKLKSFFRARNKSCSHLQSWRTIKVWSIFKATVCVWGCTTDPNRRTAQGKEESTQCNTPKWRSLAMLTVDCPSSPRSVSSLVLLSVLYPSHYAVWTNTPHHFSTALPRMGQNPKTGDSLIFMQISPSSAQAASTACNELLYCAMSSHDKTPKLHR